MNTSDHMSTRDQRRRQLTEMWKDRPGQLAVLSLFHRALPEGEVVRAGMSVFDVILQSEFGAQEDGEHGGNNGQ